MTYFVIWLSNNIALFMTALCSVYVLEKNPVTFSCPASDCAGNVVLSMVIGGYSIKIGNCSLTTCQTSSLSRNANGIHASITMNLKEIRNFSKIVVLCDNTKEFSYDVYSIGKPENMMCDQPILEDGNRFISLICTTNNVYPAAIGSVSIGNLNLNLSGFTSCTHGITTSTETNLVYYNSRCKWNVPLDYFEEGYFKADIIMYPNVINGSQFAVSNSSLLHFIKPDISLSDECFNGPNITQNYFKPDSSAYCTCHLDTIGYPPGNVSWFDDKNKDIGKKESNTTTSLSISVSNDNKQYFCKSYSSLMNSSKTVVFNVTFAKGPRTCVIQAENETQGLWNICDNKNITLICQVDPLDATPGVKSIFFVNHAKVTTVIDSPLVHNMYIAKTVTSLINSGNSSIGCESQNALFNSTTAYCEKYLMFQEPPTSAPVLSIESSRNIMSSMVTLNETYFIKCSVADGVPLVSNITVFCGNISGSFQSGNFFVHPVSFTKEMTGQNCTCIAQHITGCYHNNSSSIILNVAYISVVEKFELQNKTSVVNNGTWIEFMCEADGNPAPNITLLKDNNVLKQNYSIHNISFGKLMACTDGGFYICQTSNGVKTSQLLMNQSKTLLVNVICPFQIRFPENLTENYTAILGSTISFSFEIYGYPTEHISFTMFKTASLEKKKVEIELKNISIHQFFSTDKKILIQYTLQPPYVVINISIMNLITSDYTYYTLVVFQDEHQNITYNYSLIEGNDTNHVALDKVSKNSLLAAAVGGGVAAGCILIFIIIILCFSLNKKGKWKRKKANLHYAKKNFTVDIDNKNIYSINVCSEELLKSVVNSLTPYKNYNDIVQTITSATDIPKNMYKPEIEPRQKNKNVTEYYNYVEPVYPIELNFSDKQEIIDESFYVNHDLN